MKDLLPLKEAIYEMSLYFNQTQTDERITAYAKALQNYSPKQIIYAFKQVINSGSAFFPSLAEILKHLRPDQETKEDKAPVIVKEILQAIRSFGQYKEAEMLESVSPEARLVFLAIGNTSDIRNSENFETMSAQVERLTRGVLASMANAKKNEELQGIGIQTRTVLSPTKQEARLLNFSEFLTEKQ